MWQRRLGDLAHSLRACNETYFEPDSFRRNTNHFLQTSRTVTFLIQKQKASIPDLENWYSVNVTECWSKDSVMKWAKDSRNQVEKEGDLEMRSTLTLSLIISYLSETDIVLKTGRTELLYAGITRLRRHAEKTLPTKILSSAAIKIERGWFANSYPDMELLSLLASVYSKIFGCCDALSRHLDITLPADVPAPDELDLIWNQTRRVAYVKMHDRTINVLRAERILFNREIVPPEIQKVLSTLPEQRAEHATLEGRMDFLSQIATGIFGLYQNHQSMLFLFSDGWRAMRLIAVHSTDRIEKYIFWRTLAELVAPQNVDGMIWVSEVWLRDGKSNEHVDDMTIVGEAVLMMGLSRSGRIKQRSWGIIRSGDSAHLGIPEDSEVDRKTEAVNFFGPAMRAMGLTDSLLL
jgi:hypothetical protein